MLFASRMNRTGASEAVAGHARGELKILREKSRSRQKGCYKVSTLKQYVG